MWGQEGERVAHICGEYKPRFETSGSKKAKGCAPSRAFREGAGPTAGTRSFYAAGGPYLHLQYRPISDGNWTHSLLRHMRGNCSTPTVPAMD